MLKYLMAFVAAMALALIITPVVRSQATRLRIIDEPSPRKVHIKPIPRAGGIAVFISFNVCFLGFVIWLGLDDKVLLQELNPYLISAGLLLIFGMGLWDDIKNISPFVKLCIQIVAAALAWFGGVQIVHLTLPGETSNVLYLGSLSLPMTVLWFVLLMNAINVIDGLDGLACGSTFLTSAALFFVSLYSDKAMVALGFACLAGTCFGFLRYNFNPATIFLGDCGSYFIGSVIAILTVIGSMKGPATVAFVVPIISLGLPLMDAIFATVRRFMLGTKIFQPDRDHLHHRLLKLGLSHRTAVIILYIATLILGLIALLAIHTNSLQLAIVFASVGVLALVGIRKLGYLQYLAMDKVLGWLADLGDELGLRRGRRTFLGFQEAIRSSGNLLEMWEAVLEAASYMHLDIIGLKIYHAGDRESTWEAQFLGEGQNTDNSAQTPELFIKLPLSTKGRKLGELYLTKKLGDGDQLNPLVLRRVEQLRRTLIDALIHTNQR